MSLTGSGECGYKNMRTTAYFSWASVLLQTWKMKSGREAEDVGDDGLASFW